MNHNFSEQIELILEDGQRSGTHKLGFLKAILEYCIENSTQKEIRIPLIYIAIKQIEYYWKYYSFKTLEQSTATSGRVTYYDAFDKMTGRNTKTDDYDSIEESELFIILNNIYSMNIPKHYISALNTLRKAVFELPATKSLNVKNARIDTHRLIENYKSLPPKSTILELYQYEENFIEIPQKHIDDLNSKARLLLKIVDLYWATENIKLISAITEIRTGTYFVQPIQPGRGRLDLFMKIYKKKLGITKCQYCLERNAVAIDHIYPWKIIKRDEFWNMLPICTRCNSSKSDKVLPLNREQKKVLRIFVSYILRNHLEDFKDELTYRSIIESKKLEAISNADYLVGLTLSRIGQIKKNNN